MPQTLLLADDSVTIQRVIELTFADEDIKVVAVSDGDQAIARIDSDPPDIVLVDVGMPGRSGYEVAQHIKQAPALKHIPVLLLTGAFEPVDQTKAAEAGCDGVLAKPFEPQLVISRVKELLGRGGQAGVGPQHREAAPAEAPMPAEPPADPSRPAEVARLDNYFDQLDAAFATLSDGTPAPSPKGGAPSPALPDTLDWFGATPAARSEPAPDLPLSSAAPVQPAAAAPKRPEPEPAVPRLVRDDAEPGRGVERPKPVPVATPSAPPAALPPLADAFAAILAAEQHEPMPPVAPAWPASPIPGNANGGGALTEEAIEDITRRVLDRLSDKVVRETVADVVSSIAERLVREEIERIKSAIK